jgi:oligoribonuclease (3'-5' exoribonuclease)
MRRVVVESPYRPKIWDPVGIFSYEEEVAKNVAYARRCVRDCVQRGEAPYASHLFFTQQGILDDRVPEERKLGIEAGLEWGRNADLVAVYVDLGVSEGMWKGIVAARGRGTPIEVRALDREVTSWERELPLAERVVIGEAGYVVGRTSVEVHAQKNPVYLLWCDVECTGLDPSVHKLLEIAWILTEFAYPYEEISSGSRLVEGGLQALETHADAFVKEMHEKSGLRVVLDPMSDAGAPSNMGRARYSLDVIHHDLLELSRSWPLDKDQRVMIAGNSAHFDLSFLRVHLPELAARLSYRTFDASGFYRFCLSLGMPSLGKQDEAHRAEADVRRSLELARTCGAWVRRTR